MENGDVYTFGYGQHGQLGHGDVNSRYLPSFPLDTRPLNSFYPTYFVLFLSVSFSYVYIMFLELKKILTILQNSSLLVVLDCMVE
jgi:alpha-tubulin suppressor-like RCC1 family protein